MGPNQTNHERSVGDRKNGIPFIGAGPGNPGLLTVTGRQLLENADLVVYAGSLVNSDILSAYCSSAEQVSSASKELDEIISVLATAYNNGKSVVRLHSGDPAIYGAIVEQIDELEKRDIPTYIVPGVTAAFAGSAALQTQLTLPEVANHVVITRPHGETLEEKQDRISEFVGMNDTTTCVYLGTHAIEDIMDRLIADGHDPQTPVAVIYRASWPEEDVITGTVTTIAEEVNAAGYNRSAVMLIGKAVTKANYARSSLYSDWQHKQNTDEVGSNGDRDE
ncbi:precorrin-4 C(11)-methyltransferase [Salinarchaeum sp. IM2453]|uniref:precorrin-4 C(11)-methyltransferase n=1 Tax=Salinarchaeum sp. IM2453 TaxID=2862870 RepID=UPI001C828940|nr:precorrin-4 C(11)-methyltransferase [Salinarchaeum sp. IM2453]QZA88082.1 precorrin-4 C(11)-methyltransferase [Salinarchaeum sp. IM2453]